MTAPLSPERLAEIRSLDLLALMDDRVAAVISGHLAALLAEVERLRIVAEATSLRHAAIRERLAQVTLPDSPDSPEAWDLGMGILALLDGPAPRAEWVKGVERS